MTSTATLNKPLAMRTPQQVTAASATDGFKHHLFTSCDAHTGPIHRIHASPDPPASFRDIRRLALLQRLKSRFLATRVSSGHRLLLSVFMITSKAVGQGTFALTERNQMERERCARTSNGTKCAGRGSREVRERGHKIYSHTPPHSSHTSLSPLSIAAGPGPEKAVDRQVRLLRISDSRTPRHLELSSSYAPHRLVINTFRDYSSSFLNVVLIETILNGQRRRRRGRRACGGSVFRIGFVLVWIGT
ncbi:hypothetical protein BD410DRAFT_839370 [Rickenella mellea]|uniref:Uncharacterized protein n=1 Tax=Rickenella mellea TaxID=50990 RepID=A0A4Y7Q6X6_9AGAM|nr:hypothetical protein BD410DRAFT_839370 [Rickenella mellea]